MTQKLASIPAILSGFAFMACSACTVTSPVSGEFAAPVQVYETAPQFAAYAPPAPVRATPTSWAPEIGLVSSSYQTDDAWANPVFPKITQDRALDQRRLYASQILTELAGLQERQTLQSEPRDVRYISAEWALSAPSERTGLGFDVDVIPRFSYSRDGDFAARSFGGEVRIGQQFDRRGEHHVIDGWSLFAGADGEALMWEPGAGGEMSVDRMALRDTVTVGDMQAGIAFQMGPGQWSVSYIQREVSYRERNLGASENEEFVGITFSIRR